MPTAAELKRFSLSENVWQQVVRPLFESGNVVNPDELLGILKKLTCCLWTAGGYPQGFSGAVAGNFQELLDGYRHAIIYKQKVQFGSIGGVGGDTVRTVTEGKHQFVETTQFKVTSSGIDAIKEHIVKAAWQLTGAGGEKPSVGRNVVEVIVQDDRVQDAERGKTLGELTNDEWAEVIEEALEEGYVQNDIAKTEEELYAAVQRVVISTQRFRFLFMPLSGEVIYMGGGVPTARDGSLFSGGKFEAHWRWLATQVQALQVPNKTYNPRIVQQYGVGPSSRAVPQALLKQG